MGFFKDLTEKIGDYTLTITIQKDREKLIVSVLPKIDTKKDNIAKEIVPLNIKGTAEQLDDGFILAISQSMQLVNGLQINVKDFEAGLKKADKKTKPEDMKKDTEKNKPAQTEIPEATGNVDKETGEITEPDPDKNAPVISDKKKSTKRSSKKTVEPKLPDKVEPENIAGTADNVKTEGETKEQSETINQSTSNKDDENW
jgi:PRTRC genetic system protein E